MQIILIIVSILLTYIVSGQENSIIALSIFNIN